MKLHRIVPWGVRMNPIEFRNDDVISDVISGKSALLACKHSNSSKSYPISMKLHRIVPWGVRMTPLLNFVTMTSSMTSFPVKSLSALVNTVTQLNLI